MIPEGYRPYAKALVGFIGTLATALATTGADGELTGVEVLMAILGVIGVTTAVYQVKNRPAA